ncbi:MAG TPA: hypothetical protein VJ697_13630 [Nitrososphaeraceae archaeon]|nr:hypothetical protein [Nitrososphaeraceae archaeon]
MKLFSSRTSENRLTKSSSSSIMTVAGANSSSTAKYCAKYRV